MRCAAIFDMGKFGRLLDKFLMGKVKIMLVLGGIYHTEKSNQLLQEKIIRKINLFPKILNQILRLA